MKAKAAVFMGANVPFEVREFEITDTPAGYGRSELIASGICGTDVHFHNGKLSVAAPTIIGHEFVGRLVDLNGEEGKRYGLKKGDRVIADIAVPCGECLLCKSGDDANCVRMRVTNGGSIETPALPVRRLYARELHAAYQPHPDPRATGRGNGLHIRLPGADRHARVRARGARRRGSCGYPYGGRAGLGPVGTYAVMYLKAMGVKQVFAITAGTNARREELAKSLGASEVFNLSRTGAAQVNESIVKASGGLGADLAFEASGRARGGAAGHGTSQKPRRLSRAGAVFQQRQRRHCAPTHHFQSAAYHRFFAVFGERRAGLSLLFARASRTARKDPRTRKPLSSGRGQQSLSRRKVGKPTLKLYWFDKKIPRRAVGGFFFVLAA